MTPKTGNEAAALVRRRAEDARQDPELQDAPAQADLVEEPSPSDPAVREELDAAIRRRVMSLLGGRHGSG
jgi:hypothetical protein